MRINWVGILGFAVLTMAFWCAGVTGWRALAAAVVATIGIGLLIDARERSA